MCKSMLEKLSRLDDCVVLDSGELAWSLKSIPKVLELVSENNWIIVGGDIIADEGSYTYDNWYFQPEPACSLAANVSSSLNKCSQYISNYVSKNGSNYLFVLVISNSYIGGTM